MHHSAVLSFDQLPIGREWTSEPRGVLAADFGTYAKLTDDSEPAHVGEAYQSSGEDCAPGVFGPAVATGLVRESPPVRTTAFIAIRGWEFLRPIQAGDAVRIRNRVDAVTPRGVGRRAKAAWRVEVVNQRDDVVQTGTIVALVEGPAHGRRVPAPHA